MDWGRVLNSSIVDYRALNTLSCLETHNLTQFKVRVCNQNTVPCVVMMYGYFCRMYFPCLCPGEKLIWEPEICIIWKSSSFKCLFWRRNIFYQWKMSFYLLSSTQRWHYTAFPSFTLSHCLNGHGGISQIIMPCHAYYYWHLSCHANHHWQIWCHAYLYWISCLALYYWISCSINGEACLTMWSQNTITLDF